MEAWKNLPSNQVLDLKNDFSTRVLQLIIIAIPNSE